MYVFLEFYWILPLVGSSISPNCQKKLARTAGLFYKIRHYAPQDTLMFLYHAIFAPFLTYGVFCSTKKILRIVTFSDKTAPSSPIFDCLQVLKFSDIIILYIVSFVFGCVHNLAPTYFRNYFTTIRSIHDIGTRQSQKGDLFALRCNTTQYGLHSIHYTGVRLWNSLPCEIRDSPSLPVFRKKIKTHILENYKSQTDFDIFCIISCIVDLQIRILCDKL